MQHSCVILKFLRTATALLTAALVLSGSYPFLNGGPVVHA